MRCAEVNEWIANYIVDLVAFWDGQEHRGLPVGPNASCIISDAIMSGIDRALVREAVDYVRYVDDFRLFAPDERGATRALEIIAQLARRRRFRT